MQGQNLRKPRDSVKKLATKIKDCRYPAVSTYLKRKDRDDSGDKEGKGKKKKTQKAAPKGSTSRIDEALANAGYTIVNDVGPLKSLLPVSGYCYLFGRLTELGLS